MHHEDRAGVNAFIRGIDRIGNGRLPAAVIMCTNRLSALDPPSGAGPPIFWRSAGPTTNSGNAVLGEPLGSLASPSRRSMPLWRRQAFKKIAAYGFTFSDLTQRLLPRSCWMPIRRAR